MNLTKFRRKKRLKIYNPKRRIEFSKENTLPLFLRVCNRFVFLGGLVSFFTSSFLVGIKSFFHVKKTIKSFPKGKVIELREKSSGGA